MSQYSQIIVDVGSFANLFVTDAGNATPAAGILTLAGGTNIGTTGAGSTATINLDPTITLTNVYATTFYTNIAAAALVLTGTQLYSFGTDLNIDVNITPKGTGKLVTSELTLTTDLAVQYGGTGASTLTDHGILLGSGTAAITALGVATNGQLPIGSTGADPVLGTLTAGTGISITNGAGSITIDSTIVTWSEVAGLSQSMVVGNGYIINNAALVTCTLPNAAAVGGTIKITGKGAGGYIIAQNAGQKIYFGSRATTVGVGGSIASTLVRDSIEMVCITANTEFNVISSIGNFTIV